MRITKGSMHMFRVSEVLHPSQTKEPIRRRMMGIPLPFRVAALLIDGLAVSHLAIQKCVTFMDHSSLQRQVFSSSAVQCAHCSSEVGTIEKLCPFCVVPGVCETGRKTAAASFACVAAQSRRRDRGPRVPSQMDVFFLLTSFVLTSVEAFTV